MRRVFVSVFVLALAAWLAPFSQAGFWLATAQDAQPVVPPPVVKEQPKEPLLPPVVPPPVVKEQPKEMKPQPKPEPAPVAPQPLAQQYYERVVTCYKPVCTEREIKTIVTKMVPREVKYTCIVMVPVIKDVKRTETYWESVPKPVEYTTTVYKPVVMKEKQVVTECTMVKEVVDVKYTELVPKMTKVKKTVHYTELQPTIVEQTIPVCKTVQVPVKDCCGNTYFVCQQVVTCEKVKREVCVPVTKTKEVLCDVVMCEPQEKVKKVTMTKPVYTNKDIIVEVTRCVAESVKVKGTVCELVPKTREVMCKVKECVPVEKTGVRTVMDCVPTEVTRKVQCVEMRPFTYVERIPIVNCCRPCW